MRTAALEPIKVPGRRRPWRLNIPPSMTANGKRRQEFFRSQEAADRRVRELKEGRQTHGDMLAALSHSELSDAVRAFHLLQPHGIGLLDAVRSFLADRERRMASKTFGEVWDAYSTVKKRSPAYAESMRHTKTLVDHLMRSHVVDVTADELEAALARLSPSVRDMRITRLRSVFNYAVRKGWLEANPAARLDLSGKKPHEIRIYTADQIQRLLDVCQEHDPAFLPYLVVCAFAGLRPENEAFNLLWSDVRLDDAQPHLIVRADISKTRERRTVDLSPNAVLWLRVHQGGAGRVFPFSESTLARKRASLLEAINKQGSSVESGVEAFGWLKDGLRHTFASAHLTKYGDATKTMLAMGHKDLKMIWKNYYRHMTAEEAEKFWGIVPKGKD
jgi:integrase